MRKFIFLTALFLGTHILSSTESQAQWDSDIRITNDSAYSSTTYNNAKCIGTSGDFVHVVWYDQRDGNSEIYYKRSTDMGASWEADSRITNDSSESWNTSLAVSGLDVHIVWNDDRDGNWEIYYCHSTDGGTIWGAKTRLTNNSSFSEFSSISVSGSTVSVVWADNRDGNSEIYYRGSTDGGTTWGAETRLTNNTAFSLTPSVSVSGLVVHVIWRDFRDGNFEIYYKYSTDGGSNWQADTRLSNDFADSGDPSVSASGSFVCVVWMDKRSNNYDIYYKTSTDGGLTWQLDMPLTNSSANPSAPSVAVSDSVVHVSWQDYRDGNFEIYYNRSTNLGMSWGIDTRLTNNTSNSELPSVSASGNVAHILWTDDRDGNKEIYYKRNPTGNVTGIETIDSELPGEFKLEQNYPNPFNPTSTITFQIPSSGYVLLVVHDVLGKEVATLISEQMEAGTYTKQFDANNLTSGVYFYQLRINNFTDTKKFILIK